MKFKNIENIKDNLSNEISNFITNKTNAVNENIKNNYKLIKNDTYKIAKYCFDSKLTKPTTLYNLLFCVEISLKYYLFLYSTLNLTEIEKCGHDMNDLIDEAKKYNYEFSIDIDELEFLLTKFKTKKNKNSNKLAYENFKYNKEKKSNNLIFGYEFNDIERNSINEVLKWLNLNILNL